jgi:hypothetical protein
LRLPVSKNENAPRGALATVGGPKSDLSICDDAVATLIVAVGILTN